MRSRLFFALATLLSFACSSTLVIVEKNYEGVKVKQSSMAVMLHGEIMVRYSGNVEPEFGPGNQDSLILGYFKRAIPAEVHRQTGFDSVRFVDAPIEPGIMNNVIQLKLPNGSVADILTPASHSFFEFPDNTPAFVLVVDRLYIGTEIQTNTYWSQGRQLGPEIAGDFPELRIERHLRLVQTGLAFNDVLNYGPPVFVPSPMPMPMMHTSTTKKLIYEADISIWDNGAKALVAYGHVQSTVSSSFIPVVTMGTWEQVTRGFVRAIFEKTPFNRSLE
jgi:hypothetical protein